jgi:hypothetical protein
MQLQIFILILSILSSNEVDCTKEKLESALAIQNKWRGELRTQGVGTGQKEDFNFAIGKKDKRKKFSRKKSGSDYKTGFWYVRAETIDDNPTKYYLVLNYDNPNIKPEDYLIVCPFLDHYISTVKHDTNEKVEKKYTNPSIFLSLSK